MKKPMTKYKLPEQPKAPEHSFSVNGNYMHFGKIKTYSNKTQAEAAAAKLTLKGIRVQLSANWPYTLIPKNDNLMPTLEQLQDEYKALLNSEEDLTPQQEARKVELELDIDQLFQADKHQEGATFFVKDLSGRGYTAKLKGIDFYNDWLLYELDENGDKMLGDFIAEAEPGDTFQYGTIIIEMIEK